MIDAVGSRVLIFNHWQTCVIEDVEPEIKSLFADLGRWPFVGDVEAQRGSCDADILVDLSRRDDKHIPIDAAAVLYELAKLLQKLRTERSAAVVEQIRLPRWEDSRVDAFHNARRVYEVLEAVGGEPTIVSNRHLRVFTR